MPKFEWLEIRNDKPIAIDLENRTVAGTESIAFRTSRRGGDAYVSFRQGVSRNNRLIFAQ
jgi:hypothetical protein